MSPATNSVGASGRNDIALGARGRRKSGPTVQAISAVQGAVVAARAHGRRIPASPRPRLAVQARELGGGRTSRSRPAVLSGRGKAQATCRPPPPPPKAV